MLNKGPQIWTASVTHTAPKVNVTSTDEAELSEGSGGSKTG